MKKKLMTMLLAAGAALGLLTATSMTAYGDTLTVHDGTATSAYVPVYGFRAEAYLKCEYVLPASELTAMNGQGISDMTWYLSSPAATSWTGTFQVFLKEVASATISAYSGTNGATVVYEGTLDGTDTALKVEFSTPYLYNGGNLLVGVYQIVKGNWKSAEFLGETVNGASVQGYNGSNIDSASVNQRNFIPKTTFFYTVPSHTVSGLPTANATVTVDGVATNVPASGTISVAEGAAVKVAPSAGYRFESFAATVVEPPPATDLSIYEPGAATTKDLSTLTGDYVVPDGWTLTGTLDGSTQPYKISIAAGAKVTLRDATINGVSDNSSYAWPGLSCEGDATITLEGANKVTGFYQTSGLFVPASKTLTIRGPGSLDATGSSKGAGIGAYGTSADCGRIVISSGTIKATGGANAAGIGGGWGYYGDNNYKAQCDGIAILGGVVTATAVGYAAGIGGGRYGSCGDITISGGVVTATGHGGGAGIGAGEDGGGCGNIIISGGRVTATGSISAAGIGSGRYSNARCGTVTISSGISRVTATSPYNPIGQGSMSTCGAVTIDPSLNDTTEENTRTLTPPPFAAMANADGSYSFTVPKSDVAVTQVLGLVPEIAAVINAIDAIGEVAYTDGCKAKIDAASAAYNALTDAQKALVANADTLTAAETTYTALKAAADAAAADAAAAAAVTAAINAIGDVAYTDESKAKIDAARAAYDALTDAQRALVANYATLTTAEAAYAALAPAPEPEPEALAERVLYSEVVGAVDVNEASTWDGYLRSAGGGVAGTFLAKIGKAGKKDGKSKVTLTLQPVGAKAQKYSGTMDASGRFTAAGGVDLQFGADSVKGAVGGYRVDGSRSLFVSKRAADKIAANAILVGRKQVYPVAWKDGNGWASLTVAVAAKGKAKATGVLANGTKVSANGQLLHGDGVDCVVVVSAKKAAPIVFALWFTADGIVVEGLGDEAITAKGVSNVPNGATFRTGLLEGDYPVTVNGKKWTVPTDKELALKLTYTAKSGTFKGSFKLGKAKATVNGVVVGGKGYGSAVVKGAGPAEVTVEACNTCTR